MGDAVHKGKRHARHADVTQGGQALGLAGGEVYDEPQGGRVEMGQAQDPDAAGLDQPGDGGGGTG